MMRHMEAEVLAANEAFYRAFNEKDYAAMDALWARRASVWCIHPGWNMLSGREDVMASWQAILSNEGQPRIVAGGASTYVVGAFAVVTCRELVAGSPLAATNIFVIEDGAWRMMHHHSSPVMQVGD
jgi:ketosteroid isomerase-like protein